MCKYLRVGIWNVRSTMCKEESAIEDIRTEVLIRHSGSEQSPLERVR